MIVEGRYLFRGPRETVFRLLQDPEVLVKALPGAKQLERVGEGRYQGAANVGIGPVTAGEFAMTVEIRDAAPPETFTMDVEGKGAIGFTRGTATVTLTEEEEGTAMVYRADLQIGGKIAGVGQRLLDTASKAMTRQGLEAVNKELQARLAPPPAAGETAGSAGTQARRWYQRKEAVLVVLAAVLLIYLIRSCGGAG